MTFLARAISSPHRSPVQSLFAPRHVPFKARGHAEAGTASSQAWPRYSTSRLSIAGLTIADGKITVVEDKPGTVVDREKLREQLKALLFTLHATELPVPMKVDTPAVVAQDTQEL